VVSHGIERVDIAFALTRSVQYQFGNSPLQRYASDIEILRERRDTDLSTGDNREVLSLGAMHRGYLGRESSYLCLYRFGSC